MTPDQKRLIDQLTLHEGRKAKPYKDTVGKITIGVGRNLTDRGLSQDEIDYLLINDIVICENDLDRALPWWRELDDIRQRVMIDLCFNLGITKLLGFKNTLKHIQGRRWREAGAGLKASLWYKQVKLRGDRLIAMMVTGKDYK